MTLFFLFSCDGKKKQNSFIEKDYQNNSKQRDFEELEVGNKLDLNKLDLFYVLKLEMQDDNLFFLNGDELEIFILDKQNLNVSDVKKIIFSKGKGPAELQSITDYDVYNNEIFISDKQQGKISIYNFDGILKEEFSLPEIIADRIQVIDNNRILTFSLKTGKHVFNIINRDGDILDSFINTEPDLHYLMYSGDIYYQTGNIYFVGYSEPIIKKYNLQTKDLIYSIDAIDSYPTEDNYVKNELGGFSSSSYSPAALYSSLGYTIHHDQLYMTRHHNGNVEGKYLDIYNSVTGEYIFSYELEHFPSGYGIIVDENHIYSLEKRHGDKEWLVIYNRE